MVFRPTISRLLISAIALTALALWRADAPAAADAARPLEPHAIRVIDGDTFDAARVRYRIVNIDTPETGDRARCAAERRLGDRATHAARTLIRNAADIEIRPTGRIDSYGRTIAFLSLDGRDFGEILVERGLARPWRGRREPWCDARGRLINAG